MSFRLVQVDAFTDTPFSGNPAAVCILPTQVDAQWMQRVAAEMNLSETAFVVKHEDGYGLRWFTPVSEVDLCGHATLASAHVLWEERHLDSDETIIFHTKSGVLTCEQKEEWIEMNFPIARESSAVPPDVLVEGLGLMPRYVGKSEFDYLVEVDSEAAITSLVPDFQRLQMVPMRGCIVTAHSDDPEYDFISRFFAPRLGVNEDPVTGSAHCCLGPFWAKRLRKEELTAYQASPRGGVVRMRMLGERIVLGGKAVTVMQGDLL